MTGKRPAKKAAKKSGKRISQKAKPAPKRPGRPKTSYRTNLPVARNADRTIKERIAALARLSSAICDDDDVFQTVLDVLRDSATPSPVRLAALQVLQGASFSVLKFNACRPAYLAALRSVAKDPDLELRQRVLGILSREKDGRTERMLLDGLRDPAKALLPPEKALQLLSYDVHADAYPVAREIVRAPPNEDAKREALRLLAADAASAPVFERILRDKREPPDVRQISASALHALAPDALQTHAREIVLDESEPDDLRATSLTALNQFGKEEVLDKDEALHRRVDQLEATTPSRSVKEGAQQFLGKYRR